MSSDDLHYRTCRHDNGHYHVGRLASRINGGKMTVGCILTACATAGTIASSLGSQLSVWQLVWWGVATLASGAVVSVNSPASDVGTLSTGYCNRYLIMSSGRRPRVTRQRRRSLTVASKARLNPDDLLCRTCRHDNGHYHVGRSALRGDQVAPRRGAVQRRDDRSNPRLSGTDLRGQICDPVPRCEVRIVDRPGRRRAQLTRSSGNTGRSSTMHDEPVREAAIIRAVLGTVDLKVFPARSRWT
jgi:hypothetical protein